MSISTWDGWHETCQSLGLLPHWKWWRWEVPLLKRREHLPEDRDAPLGNILVVALDSGLCLCVTWHGASRGLYRPLCKGHKKPHACKLARIEAIAVALEML